MFMKRGWVLLAALLVCGVASAQVLPTSYDLPNGDGVASGGAFNYWDLNYTGSGSTNVDGAALAGGLGDLTDGVIATDNWFNVESVAGTGPYVGWRAGLRGDPTVTFRFASGAVIDSLTVYADDSDGAGGVSLPDAVVINGTSFDVDQSAVGAEPKVLTFSNLGFVGDALDVQFIRSNEWIFVSEVTFDGQLVPEPMSIAILSLGSILLIRRRSRKA